ncbi:hypothetical protein QR78_07565 [Methylobacterium indicum]|uniref:Uncharacterized protein n=2 Tax=Methylobacterium indicum TaxID=1775910 RepID=A0ABR5HDJ7_9HYPH|nr:hypothetical protein QR78_07565 [Methylobacterium indicum]KMO24309.1 hypothetical protein QR79_11910 [Methylobacterium indicum]
MKGRTLVLALGAGLLLVSATLVGGPLLAIHLSKRPLVPATPSLLQDVRAGSGWASMGCPQPTSPSFASMSEALSPDLTPRLDALFPPGSDADALQTVLVAQGFGDIATCKDDPSIHHTAFRQTGGGFAGPYPIFAVVAWRRSEDGRVAWMKGFVSYLAP